MPRDELPVRTGADPVRWNPMIAGSLADPVSVDPDVVVTAPAPVPRHPDVTVARGRNGDHARRRRRDPDFDGHRGGLARRSTQAGNPGDKQAHGSGAWLHCAPSLAALVYISHDGPASSVYRMPRRSSW